MLKRLLIWILLIALPLQAFAATAKMHCAPSQQAASVGAASDMPCHDHHTSMQQTHDDGACQGADHQADRGDKCSACHTCCIGMMAQAPFQPDFLLAAGTHVLAPYRIDRWSSVFLEGPQRPPRPSFA